MAFGTGSLLMGDENWSVDHGHISYLSTSFR